MNIDTKLKRYLSIAAYALTVIMFIVFSFVLNKAIFWSDIYGIKWIVGLVVTIIVASVGVTYYFSNFEKQGKYNYFFAWSLLTNVLSVLIIDAIVVGVNKLLPDIGLSSSIGAVYSIFYLTVIFTTITFCINLFIRFSHNRLTFQKRFSDILNFLIPPIAFLLIAMFLIVFRLMVATILGTLLISFVSVLVTNNIFKNAK